MPPKTSSSIASRRLKVGSRVIFCIGPSKIRGRIIEDRGRIGVNGRRLVRVIITGRAAHAEQDQTFELPADDLVLAR